MSISKASGSKTPPAIGKMGPYTVFITPTPTPTPKPVGPVLDSPAKVVPPPVQPPPPHRFGNSVASPPLLDHGSVLAFFKNAATKLQKAQSSLDSHMARWLGLDQSRYQWALENYYDNQRSVCSTKEQEGQKNKMSNNLQSV
ncbi:hypothetical protein BT93_L4079 [Corymbia citriodora subsp. variegata]|uniref:Uncharacterized protein n=1 Tax=Corymbia citriodora subsp. variegata TaxID=360336 RepID=A0A8T0CUS0_CORYI|nr:hypothetical protein BT93_L4079 [Corymbia citriodora subsp. variegata]